MHKIKKYIKTPRCFSRPRRAAEEERMRHALNIQEREQRLSATALDLLEKAKSQQRSLAPEVVRRLINEKLGINDIEAAPDVGRRRNLYTVRTKRACDLYREIIAEADAHRARVVARARSSAPTSPSWEWDEAGYKRPHVGTVRGTICNKPTTRTRTRTRTRTKAQAQAKLKTKAKAQAKAKLKSKAKAQAKAKLKAKATSKAKTKAKSKAKSKAKAKTKKLRPRPGN